MKQRMKSLLVAAAATMLTFGAFAVGEFEPINGGTFDTKASTETNMVIVADQTAQVKGNYLFTARIWAVADTTVTKTCEISFDGEYFEAMPDAWRLVNRPGYAGLFYCYDFTSQIDRTKLEKANKAHGPNYGKSNPYTYTSSIWIKWFGEDDNIVKYTVKFDPKTLIVKSVNPEKDGMFWWNNLKLDNKVAIVSEDAATNKVGFAYADDYKTVIISNTKGAVVDKSGYSITAGKLGAFIETNGLAATKFSLKSSANTQFDLYDYKRDYLHTKDYEEEPFSKSTPKFGEETYTGLVTDPSDNEANIEMIASAAMNGHDLVLSARYDFNKNGLWKDEDELKIVFKVNDPDFVLTDAKGVTNWPCALDKVNSEKGAVDGRTVTYTGDVFGDMDAEDLFWTAPIVIDCPAYVTNRQTSVSCSDSASVGPIENGKLTWYPKLTIADLAYLPENEQYAVKTLTVKWGDMAEPVVYTAKYDKNGLELFSSHTAGAQIYPVKAGEGVDGDYDFLAANSCVNCQAADKTTVTTDGLTIKEGDDGWKAAYSIYMPTWYGNNTKAVSNLTVAVNFYTNGVAVSKTSYPGLLSKFVKEISYDDAQGVKRCRADFAFDILQIIATNDCMDVGTVSQDLIIHWSKSNPDAISTYTLAIDQDKVTLVYKDGAIGFPLSTEGAAFDASKLATGPLTNDVVSGNYEFPVVLTLPEDISSNNWKRVQLAFSNNYEDAVSPFISLETIFAVEDSYFNTNKTVTLDLARYPTITKELIEELIKAEQEDSANVLTYKVYVDLYGRGKADLEYDAEFAPVKNQTPIWFAEAADRVAKVFPLNFEGGKIISGKSSVDFDVSTSGTGTKNFTVTGTSAGKLVADFVQTWELGQFTIQAPEDVSYLNYSNAWVVALNSDGTWKKLGPLWFGEEMATNSFGAFVYEHDVWVDYRQVAVNKAKVPDKVNIVWNLDEEADPSEWNVDSYTATFDYSKDGIVFYYSDGTTQAWPMADATDFSADLIDGDVRKTKVNGKFIDNTNLWAFAASATGGAVSYSTDAKYANLTNVEGDVLWGSIQVTAPSSVNQFNYKYVPCITWDYQGNTNKSVDVAFRLVKGKYVSAVPYSFNAQVLQEAFEQGESCAYTLAFDFDFDGKFETLYTFTVDPTKVTLWKDDAGKVTKVCPLDMEGCEIVALKQSGDKLVEDKTLSVDAKTLSFGATVDWFANGPKEYYGGEIVPDKLPGIGVNERKPGAYVTYRFHLPKFVQDNPAMLDKATYGDGQFIKDVLTMPAASKANEWYVDGAFKMLGADFIAKLISSGKKDYTHNFLTVKWADNVSTQYKVVFDLTKETKLDFMEVIDEGLKTNTFLQAWAIDYRKSVSNFCEKAEIDLGTLPKSLRIVDEVELPTLTSDNDMFLGWTVDDDKTNVIARGVWDHEPSVRILSKPYNYSINGENSTNDLFKGMAALKDGDTIKFKNQNAPIPVGDWKNKVAFTLDLNGSALAVSADDEFTAKADVTLQNGSVTNKASIVVDGCTLTLDGVEVVADGCTAITAINGGRVVVLENSKVVVTGRTTNSAIAATGANSAIELNGLVNCGINSYAKFAAVSVDAGAGLVFGEKASVECEKGVGVFCGKDTVAQFNSGAVWAQTGVYFMGKTLSIPDESTFAVVANGSASQWAADSGLQNTGNAITIEIAAGQELNIAGGAFKATAAAIAAYPADATFEGFVTGGLWGDISFESCLAEDYAVMLNEDEETKQILPFAVDELVSETFTVTFTGCPKNPDAIPFTKKDLKKGGKYEFGIVLPTDVEKPGYEFVGWKADGQTITVIHEAKNYTLTAEWKQLPFVVDDPVEGDVFTGKKAKTYYGNIVDANGQIVGTVTFKTTKVSKGKSTVSATVKMVKNSPKSYTVKGTAKEIDGEGLITDLELTAKKKLPLTISAMSDYNASGSIIDAEGNELTIKSAVAADAQMIGKAMGKWNVAVQQEENGAWASFNVSVSSKGKATIKGTLANGTAISQSAYVVAGVNSACVPFVCTKANLAFELWFSGSDREIVVINTTGVASDPVAAYYGNGDETEFEAGYVAAEISGEIGTISKVDYKLANEFYAEMTGYPYEGKISSKGKISAVKVAKTEGGKKAAFWAPSYSASSGSFGGKVNVYGRSSKNKTVSKKLTLKGKLINGQVFGTAYIKVSSKDIRTLSLEVVPALAD